MVETINTPQTPQTNITPNPNAGKANARENVSAITSNDNAPITPEQVRLALEALSQDSRDVASVSVSPIDSSHIDFHAVASVDQSIEGLTFNIQDALIALFQLSVALREVERNNWIATANDILEKGESIAETIRHKASMSLTAGIVGGSTGIAAGVTSIGGGAAALGTMKTSAGDATPNIDVDQASLDGAQNLSSSGVSADMVAGDVAPDISPTSQTDLKADLRTSDIADTTRTSSGTDATTATDVGAAEAVASDATTTEGASHKASKTTTLDRDHIKIQQDLTKAKIAETRVDSQNQKVQARLQVSEGVSSLIRSGGQMSSAGIQYAADEQEAVAEIQRSQKERLNVQAQTEQDFSNELRDTVQSIVQSFQNIEQARHRAMGAIYNA